MIYDALSRWLSTHPRLTRMARRGQRLIPDVPVTRTIPGIGPLRFGIRRHRWLLGRHCLAGHRGNFQMFRRLIHPNDVVYDIGANIGYYARYMVANLPLSKLIAFEPMAGNLRLLRRNVELGRCSERMSVLALALSDVDGEELLQVDDVAGGTAVLDSVSGGEPAAGRRRLGLGPKTESVQVRRLDTAIREYALPPPQFVKIDTEGAELPVLRGAMKVLDAHGPRLAIAGHDAEHVAQAVELLGDLGYACYGFVGDRTPMAYQRLSPHNVHSLCDNNFFCSRRVDEVRDPRAAGADQETPIQP